MLKKLFQLLFPLPVSPPAFEPNTFERWRRAVTSLGPATAEIIFCLGGSEPRNSTYFDPFLTQALGLAALEHFQILEQRLRQSVPSSAYDTERALVAAGLFSCGQATALAQMIEHAPEYPIQLDHGAGHCLQAPIRAVLRIVPVPAYLQSPEIWSRDNPLLQEFVQWYDQHRHELTWNEVERKYIQSTQ